jgi:hypothetical protein
MRSCRFWRACPSTLRSWSSGGFEVLLLCEEAHRYVPQDRSSALRQRAQAIARIAKEGRKYGCYVGIVTQRPGELDPTILSQCSTVFAMRLATPRPGHHPRGDFRFVGQHDQLPVVDRQPRGHRLRRRRRHADAHHLPAPEAARVAQRKARRSQAAETARWHQPARHHRMRGTNDARHEFDALCGADV